MTNYGNRSKSASRKPTSYSATQAPVNAVNDSAAEILDVVNANDEVIGHATRGEIHAMQLLHRAVHILVFKPNDGDIYVQKRSLRKDCSPGLWDTSAAGHVDSEETYLEAAGRELHEELSLREDTSLTEIAKLDASSNTGFEFVRVYRCETAVEPIPDPEEISAGRWIDRGALMQWVSRTPQDFTSTFREICSLNLVWRN